MKSIRSLYYIVRLVLLISLALFPKSGCKEKYDSHQGEYLGSRGTLKILLESDGLAVDIPGKMVFELDEPDEMGRWYFKIPENATIVFEQGDPRAIKGKNKADLD